MSENDAWPGGGGSGHAVCGYWLFTEGTADPFLDYDGTDSFSRCTRCKGVFYRDKGAQKKHWKRHKKCCRLLDDDDIQAIAELSLDRCKEAVEEWLRNRVGGPETYYHLKRLRVLFDDDADGTGDAAFELHSLGRGLIFNPSDHMLTVAASPGMAQLLFGDEEDLLNSKTRLAKTQLAKYNGRPSDEYIDAIEDEEERTALRELCDTYDKLDGSWGQPSSMSYCYLYFNLLVASAVRGGRSGSSVHDGKGTLRGGDPRRKTHEGILAAASLRRAMTLWTDPLVLESCGDAMAPAASLALTAMEYYQSNKILGKANCRPHELVPGLPIDRAVMTFMKELSDGAGSAQYSAEGLRFLGSVVTNPEGVQHIWADLSVERRATVVLAIISYVVYYEEDDGSSFYSKPSMQSEQVNDLFKTICGMQNPKDEDLAKSVWKKAADDGECIGPEAAGQNCESRSFMYYLGRKASGGDNWDSMDIVELIKTFDGIPRVHRAPDDAEAKEKDECMRLAYGDKLHEEINAILRR